MIKTAARHFKILVLFLIDLILRFGKLLTYLRTGKHELQRILEAPCDIYEKTMQIDQWLERTHCEQIREFITLNISIGEQVDRIISLYNYDDHLLSKVKKKRPSKTKSPKNRAESLEFIENGDILIHAKLNLVSQHFGKLIKKLKRCKLNKTLDDILYDVLYRILCYKFSLLFVQKLAATKYDSNRKCHTDRLINFWNNLVEADQVGGRESKTTNKSFVFPEELCEKVASKDDIVSNRWSHVGFQGEDPGTDFRGMGMLGLSQLEYLSRRPGGLARDLLQRSLNEQYSYPLAIVGINITFNLVNLLKDGSLKHLYYDTGEVLFRNKQRNLNVLSLLYDIYVELYLRFDCFWYESRPENILAFRELMEEFVNVVRMDLCNRNFTLKFIY